MKVTITLRELIERGKWSEYCAMRGVDPWCINEGRATGDEEDTLTVEECAALGISIP